MLTPLVKEVEGEGDLGGVEAGVLLGQTPLPLHVKHQVPSSHKLYHKEQPAKKTKKGGLGGMNHICDCATLLN